MVAWATNGRKDFDGKVYRAAVRPYDPNGLTLDQAAQAVRTVTGLRLVQPPPMNRAEVTAWLRNGHGLVITGMYSEIPRAYRFQAAADFGHAMFATHISGTRVRLYDPLDPATHSYGRWVPASLLWPFLASRGFTVAYVALQPL
jgi:hypothetical protein